ncbi:nuclear transport factor 2 family protein [Nocardioides nitrophenolicus]|uniref:nuclear transport factor 2 family protein n=1 Tax=Nocardioides nitrophenolicus TaxID=60489 RepID=UPI00195A3616|nr:nuclear transport factor 2 family protein [Nocardioides nitrophenolicus]MBM7516478.1 ketosteroid isomerase-like protein [Nocardioides nitrophenolicus]
MNLDDTTTTILATDETSTRRALRELADKDAIRALGALYSIAVDDHDLATVVRCFADDGSFTRAGTTYAGHAVLREFYAGMMDRYVTTLHIPNSHVIDVDTEAGTATGLLTGQAELALGNQLLMAAYRYDDSYLRLDTGRWVFAARELRFMYNLPVEQMPTGFADARRIRLPGTAPVEGDFPETLPTWSTYRG